MTMICVYFIPKTVMLSNMSRFKPRRLTLHGGASTARVPGSDSDP